MNQMPTNQQLQSQVFHDNADFLVSRLNEEWFFSQIPDVQWINAYSAMKGRVEIWNNLWWNRKIEMDIISMILLSQTYGYYHGISSNITRCYWFN